MIILDDVECKYTNAELVEHNKLINNYCEQVSKATKDNEDSIIKPCVGEVLCARFVADKHWYRVVVTSCNDEANKCLCYFVDYGNTETVLYKDLLRVSEKAVPAIKRVAFGFFATLVGQDEMKDVESGHHLDSLFNEYLMVQEKGRSKANHWLVEIPKVAYNTPYWLSVERALQTS